MIVVKTKIDAKSQQLVRTLKFDSGNKVRLFGDLSFDVRQMYLLARFGVDIIKARVSRTIGSDDAPMPPLKKGYAIRKGRNAWRTNRRDLNYTGEMLENFTVRSVSASQARLDITSAKQRIKARSNERRAPWFGWSPRDIAKLSALAQELWRGDISKMGFGTGRGREFASRAIWMDPMGLRGPRVTGPR